MLVYRSVPCRGRSHIPRLESRKTIIFKSAKLHGSHGTVPYTVFLGNSPSRLGVELLLGKLEAQQLDPTPICRDSVDSVVRPQDETPQEVRGCPTVGDMTTK